MSCVLSKWQSSEQIADIHRPHGKKINENIRAEVYFLAGWNLKI
jgi:hypothetical protein